MYWLQDPIGCVDQCGTWGQLADGPVGCMVNIFHLSQSARGPICWPTPIDCILDAHWMLAQLSMRYSHLVNANWLVDQFAAQGQLTVYGMHIGCWHN